MLYFLLKACAILEPLEHGNSQLFSSAFTGNCELQFGLSAKPSEYKASHQRLMLTAHSCCRLKGIFSRHRKHSSPMWPMQTPLSILGFDFHEHSCFNAKPVTENWISLKSEVFKTIIASVSLEKQLSLSPKIYYYPSPITLPKFSYNRNKIQWKLQAPDHLCQRWQQIIMEQVILNQSFSETHRLAFLPLFSL